LFSFNGIDYLHPEERHKALAEAFRVLRPGGRFSFSTHNLRVLGNRLPGFRTRFPKLSRNPVTFASRCFASIRTCVAGRRNYRQRQQYEFMTGGVAWVNDGTHDYSLLTCYVSPETMVEQVRAAGFKYEVEVIGLDGHPAPSDSRDPWLYLIATKPG
jgi:SAM-dependent methyltransferase